MNDQDHQKTNLKEVYVSNLFLSKCRRKGEYTKDKEKERNTVTTPGVQVIILSSPLSSTGTGQQLNSLFRKSEYTPCFS